MLKHSKQEDVLVSGYKDFVRRHNRIPSIRELGEHIGWKKSITHKYIERLVGRGVFQKEEGVSKSLILAKD